MGNAVKYVMGVGGPFPKRWRAADGRMIRVFCEPAEGYVMARFKGAAPFTIHVRELMNAAPSQHGPFEPIKGRAPREEGGRDG